MFLFSNEEVQNNEEKQLILPSFLFFFLFFFKKITKPKKIYRKLLFSFLLFPSLPSSRTSSLKALPPSPTFRKMGDIQSKDGSFPKSPVGESVVKKEKRPKKRASVEPLTSAIEMATLEDSKKAKTPKKKKSEKKQTKRKSSRPSLDPSITNATTDVGSSVDPHLTPLNKKKKKKVKSFSIDASSNFNQQSSTATSLSPVNATKRVLRHPQQVLSPRSSFLFESEVNHLFSLFSLFPSLISVGGFIATSDLVITPRNSHSKR